MMQIFALLGLALVAAVMITATPVPAHALAPTQGLSPAPGHVGHL